MLKQFDAPVRLQVYLEREDLQRITERARSEGKLLSEWAREKLLAGVEDNPGVRREAGAVRVAKRRIGSGPVAQGSAVATGSCPHHKRRGELCYKCDPKFGLPAIE